MTRKTKRKPTSRSYEPKPAEPKTIMQAEYASVQKTWEHFNRELFDGELPELGITYQSHGDSYGHYSPRRFSGRVNQLGLDELH